MFVRSAGEGGNEGRGGVKRPDGGERKRGGDGDGKNLVGKKMG